MSICGGVVSMVCGRDTGLTRNDKIREHHYNMEELHLWVYGGHSLWGGQKFKHGGHGFVFSRIHFFDFILVLVFDSVGFASAGALPFP